MLLEENGMVFLSNGDPFINPILTEVSAASGDVSTDDKMPSLVGGYQVGALLGKGGFGEVRVGTHQLTAEKVALKFLKKSEIMSMGAAERTVTEIQCLMAMRHQTIIRLYQVSTFCQFEWYCQIFIWTNCWNEFFFTHQHVESPHHYVLIFELMEGGDLWNYLRKLPERREEEGVTLPPNVPPMALTEEQARNVFHQVSL